MPFLCIACWLFHPLIAGSLSWSSAVLHRRKLLGPAVVVSHCFRATRYPALCPLFYLVCFQYLPVTSTCFRNARFSSIWSLAPDYGHWTLDVDGKRRIAPFLFYVSLPPRLNTTLLSHKRPPITSGQGHAEHRGSRWAATSRRTYEYEGVEEANLESFTACRTCVCSSSLFFPLLLMVKHQWSPAARRSHPVCSCPP